MHQMIRNRMTPASVADIRAEIDRARAARDKLTEYIGALELALKLSEGLTSTRTDRIVSTVDVQAPNLSSTTKRAAGRAQRKGVAQRMLYEKNTTIADLAKELGEKRARVSKWFGPPEENRPIPKHLAERIRDKYGIPLSAWSRIAE
jgi:AraC-like DNA-binding protein